MRLSLTAALLLLGIAAAPVWADSVSVNTGNGRASVTTGNGKPCRIETGRNGNSTTVTTGKGGATATTTVSPGGHVSSVTVGSGSSSDGSGCAVTRHRK